MFGLGKHSDERVCFVVIDIGSGSVGVAIMISEAGSPRQQPVWSHREYALIRDVIDAIVPFKEVTTCLVNAFLKLGHNGMQALHSTDPHCSITDLQVTISAPWSYTITKHVTYNDDKPFVITERLLHDLLEVANQEALQTTAKTQALETAGLTFINTDIAGVIANGYTIPEPIGVTTNEIEVVNTIGITDRKLIEVITDSQNKILPQATLQQYTFMHVYYTVLQDMRPDTSEACLIDVTSEATEIGIIREGVLTQVTHAPTGTFTLARSIAAATEMPKEEAFLFMNGGEHFVAPKLSTTKQAALDAVLADYETTLAKLFTRTGDALSIPKSLFVHTDVTTEAFFLERIEHAAKTATGTAHSAHPITSRLLDDTALNDTALALSAQFAHSNLLRGRT